MKLKYFSLFIILLFTGVACTDLDEKWYSAVVPETFFKTEKDVNAALYRPFTHLRNYDSSWNLQEYSGDQMAIVTKGPHWYNGGENYRYHYHEWSINDRWIWQSWTWIFKGIAFSLDAMQDLNNLDYTNVGLTEEDKANHLMQLQTLIAYFYLRGLDLFGGLPIFTSNEGENLPRNTDIETFEHIEKLLLEGIQKLPKKQIGQKEEGSIKQAAAASMLAQLYFNAEFYIGENKFKESAAICKDIIDGKYGEYAIDQDWFGPNGFYNDKSPEIIWSLPSEFNKLELRWFYPDFYHYESLKYFGISRGANNGGHLQPSRKPTGEIYSEFKLGKPFEKLDDGDIRKQPYVYKGGGKYEGMFLVGRQESAYGSSLGAREYKGQGVLYFVDMVARFTKVGDIYPDIASLPSTMADGEENSGIRLVKVPIPNESDESLLWGSDIPFIRLAEIYYMMAECKLRDGDKEGAAKLINQVRMRNFEKGDDPNPVTAENLDEFRMLDEWGVEFLGEGRRRTDLIRWKMFLTESWWDHESSVSEHLKRYPVPQNAIAGNNALEQNPGY